MLTPISMKALCTTFAILVAAPAFAAGEILITQAKALAGNVTPGDAAGFPVTLTLPGAYQFASNILPTAGTLGIHVAQRNVTLDLNGFELHGAGAAVHGIVGTQPGATVRNGTVTGFGNKGIYTEGDFWTVENMRVVGNGQAGVTGGDHFRIKNSTASVNLVGIACGTSCLVEGNVVSENLAEGVSVGTGTVLGNTIIGNGGFGIVTPGATFAVGFGNNTLRDNFDDQVTDGVYPLEPNLCAACPS